ncbi:hypothetical protein [Natrinema sp. SYSU A 869]|uniref:hypothetical protein n=1 Tax=Natrinema sp. SYSU A 869 TaxID=2871694 RepID=UPI002103A38E|nr:hypothetical protein [Natrinema sp. SYSU A 869]
MPKESSNDVLSAGVREPLEVFEDWLCSTVFEMFVPRFVFRFDLRDLDALAHPRFDGVDRRAKLEEDAECLEIATECDRLDILARPDAEAVDTLYTTGLR